MRRPFLLVVALLVGCSSDTQAPGFAPRFWPMNVPGMMDTFVPVVDVKDGEAVPEDWTVCGATWYCCYEIRCEDGVRKTSYDWPVCPARFQMPETRDDAWHIWDGLVTRTMANKSKTKYPLCWRETASCYDHTHGHGICFNYPN